MENKIYQQIENCLKPQHQLWELSCWLADQVEAVTTF